MTRDRMFMAFLAAGGAAIAGAVWTSMDPGPLPFLLTCGWQLVFLALAFLLYRRGPLR